LPVAIIGTRATIMRSRIKHVLNDAPNPAFWKPSVPRILRPTDARNLLICFLRTCKNDLALD
jgi:hypothetical protein